MKTSTVTYLTDCAAAVRERWLPWDERGAPPDPAVLRHLGTHDPDAIADVQTAFEELEALMADVDAHGAVQQWIAASRCYDEQRRRVAALHTLELLTPLRVPPLVAGDHTHPDVEARKRCLFPVEWGTVRLVALQDPRGASAVALCEAGAGTSELQGLATSQFRHIEGRWHVLLPGSPRIAARRVVIATWATGSVSEMLASAAFNDDVLYSGVRHASDKVGRVASIAASIDAVLQDVGLDRDRSVSVTSLTHTGARALYERSHGDLELVAAMLGQSDLVRVAERIGLDH